MNKILITICSVITLSLGLVGCSEERITLNEGNYVMFADSVKVLPIQNDTDFFEIAVTSTSKCDYDRTYGVEIIDKESDAIEGIHYVLESSSVTIKSGENTTFIRIKGFHNKLEVEGVKNVRLQLIAPKDSRWDLYNNSGLEAKIILKKVCPFDINIFTGYVVLKSTYFASYMQTTERRLPKSEIDSENENTVILKDFFYDGFNLKIRLNTENPLTPDAFMDEAQVIGKTDEAFGTIYGNGNIMSDLPSSYTSYYSTCEKFMALYTRLYVVGVGTVGTYVNVLNWISDEEAEIIKNEGF